MELRTTDDLTKSYLHNTINDDILKPLTNGYLHDFAGVKNFGTDVPSFGFCAKYITNSKTFVKALHDFQVSISVVTWASTYGSSIQDANTSQTMRRDYNITLLQIVMNAA